MDAALQRLINEASRARTNAYAPYSNFPVGAAIECDDGTVYAGSNVENAAYPLGCCAEASAISAMVTAGTSHTISRIVVAGPIEGVCTPCGGCRQKLNEFTEGDVTITICNNKDEIVGNVTMADLLPMAFGPRDVLGNE